MNINVSNFEMCVQGCFIGSRICSNFILLIPAVDFHLFARRPIQDRASRPQPHIPRYLLRRGPRRRHLHAVRRSGRAGPDSSESQDAAEVQLRRLLSCQALHHLNPTKAF